jgi:hydrogenase nickel incorporation protein HypB
VTEGDDKPGKYPKAFRTSQACVVSKLDLMPHVPFQLHCAIEDAHAIQSEMKFFPVCSLTGAGIEAWCEFLRDQRAAQLTADPGT